MNWLSLEILGPVLTAFTVFALVIAYFVFVERREKEREQEARFRRLEEQINKPSQEQE